MKNRRSQRCIKGHLERSASKFGADDTPRSKNRHRHKFSADTEPFSHSLGHSRRFRHRQKQRAFSPWDYGEVSHIKWGALFVRYDTMSATLNGVSDGSRHRKAEIPCCFERNGVGVPVCGTSTAAAYAGNLKIERRIREANHHSSIQARTERDRYLEGKNVAIEYRWEIFNTTNYRHSPPIWFAGRWL